MAYLYILKCSDQTYYCGITTDIVRRLYDHQHATNKYTMKRLPIVLKYLKEVESMKVARGKEVRVKKQGVKSWYMRNKFKDKDSLPIKPYHAYNSQQPLNSAKS